MFGKFVFSFLFGLHSFAAQKGTVTAETADIYQSADFDSPVVATVLRGEVYDISDTTTGPFYKIRLKDKRLGWISDVDIKTGKTKIKKDEPPKALESHQEQKNLENRFIVLRFQGPRFEILNWREKALGHHHSAQMNQVGWGWTGTSTLMEGPIYMDSSFSVAWEAPRYYKNITGQKTTGALLRLQTAFLSPHEITEKLIYSYGLGPVMTYAHFESGKKYDDLYYGAFIPIGLAYRIADNGSAQFWYRYFIEKNQTSSISLGWAWRY